MIGGGAAGLLAATYLARYRRSVQVVDAGDSRLQSIPRTRRHPRPTSVIPANAKPR